MSCLAFPFPEVVLASHCPKCSQRLDTITTAHPRRQRAAPTLLKYSPGGRITVPELVQALKHGMPARRVTGFPGGAAVCIRDEQGALHVLVFQIDQDWTAQAWAGNSIRTHARQLLLEEATYHPDEPIHEPAVVDGMLLVASGSTLFGIDLYGIASEEIKPVRVASLDDGSVFISGPALTKRAICLAIRDSNNRAHIQWIDLDWDGERLMVRADRPWPTRRLQVSQELPDPQQLVNAETNEATLISGCCASQCCVVPAPESLFVATWEANSPASVRWDRAPVIPEPGMKLAPGSSARRMQDTQGEAILLQATGPGSKQIYRIHLRTPTRPRPMLHGSERTTGRLSDTGVFSVTPTGGGCTVTCRAPFSATATGSSVSPQGIGVIGSLMVLVESPHGSVDALRVMARRGGAPPALYDTIGDRDALLLGDPVVMGNWAAIVWAGGDDVHCEWVHPPLPAAPVTESELPA